MSKTTHIICILDRSGSMGRMTEEVISNFNNFISEQKELEGKAKLTLVIFDDKYELIYDEANLQKTRPLTSEQFYARGMTAMNDAIGRTLTNKMNKKRAIVLIHTDGQENASTEYSSHAVKNLVDNKKGKWEFIFAGANIDARSTGMNYGFNNNVQTSITRKGLHDSYQVFNATTACYRAGNDVSDIINTPNVAEAIEPLSPVDLSNLTKGLDPAAVDMARKIVTEK